MANTPRALVVGYRGQDGTYLTELLQSAQYEVFGAGRPGAVPPNLAGRVTDLDVRDAGAAVRLIRELRPDELYYLAAFHHSSEEESLDTPALLDRSLEVNALAFTAWLEAVATARPECRIFYAASSRVFGNPITKVQSEETPLNPVCAYGISKAAGVFACRTYRQSRSLFCSAGILYNHESPRRAPRFVSKKIVASAVAICRGRRSKLELGSLDTQVDWGYAPDYTAAMHAILQTQEPGDFIVASGHLHSVRDFVEIAFQSVGLDWREFVTVDPQLLSISRPVAPLQGDIRRAAAVLGWRPGVSFERMIHTMVTAELESS